MNKKTLVIGLITLSILELTGCTDKTSNTLNAQANSTKSVSAKAEDEKIEPAEVTSKSIKNEEERGSCDYKIPVVKLKGKYAQSADALNLILTKDFEELQSSDKEKIAGFKEAEEIPKDMRYRFNTDFNVKYNKDGIISIYVNYASYTGGAHEYLETRYYNYDFKANRIIELQNVFTKGVDYKNIINDEIIKQIEKDKNGYFPDAAGTVKDSLNSLKFYLKDEGVVITFPPYSLSSFGSGEREFLIIKEVSFKQDIHYETNGTNQPSQNSTEVKKEETNKVIGKEVSDQSLIDIIKNVISIENEIIFDSQKSTFKYQNQDYGRLSSKYSSEEKINSALRSYATTNEINQFMKTTGYEVRNGIPSLIVGNGTSPDFTNSKVLKRSIKGDSLMVTISQEFMGEKEEGTYIFKYENSKLLYDGYSQK